MTLIRSRTTARMAAAAAAAVTLPALVASPASAERTTGFQDIRDYACSPGSTSVNAFDDMTNQLPEYVLGADCLFVNGITQGTTAPTIGTDGLTGGQYSPAVNVPRYQMAVFVARQAEAAGLELDTTDAGFGDLGTVPSEEAVDAINGLANAGVVLGFTEEEFRPRLPITRQQMASFINRLQDAIADDDDGVDGAVAFGAPPATSPFSDAVNDDVRVLAAAGIVQGKADGSFDPQGLVTRAQMSAFLTRHLNALTEQVGGLAPFEVDNNLFSSITVTQTGEAAGLVATYVASGLEAGREYRITLVNTDAYETVEFDDGDADGSTTGDIDDVDLVSFGSSTARTGAPVAGEPTSGGDVYTADPGDAGAVTGDTTRPGAAVVTVNGQVLAGPAAGRSVLATAADNGTITFGVSGRGADVTLAPFVYQNAPSADYPNYNTLLEVNSRNIADLVDGDDDNDDTDLSNVPVELYGVGEATDFDTPDPVAAPATPGSVSGLVTDDSDDDNSFNVRSSGYQSFTYSYDADDTFFDPSGTAYATVGAFEAALTDGDTVQITDYNPTGSSRFQVSADPDTSSPARVIRAANDDDDTVTGTVTAVSTENNTVEVTGGNASLTFTYDDNDTFIDPDDNAYADTAAFETALSEGDTLSVGDYDTDPAETSAFTIDADPDAPAPDPDPAPAPRAATDADSGATGTVSEVDTDANTFALVIDGATVTFTYDDTDDAFTGDVSTFAAFDGVLSDGDTVTVDPYSTTGVSTFDLSNFDD